MQFSDVQKQMIDSRNKNLLVSASAGAGKTSTLVERLCSMVINDHIPVDSILAITFTEDAAREIKDRLKKRLYQEDVKDPWIADQLTLLETANISTIHGFCNALITKYYYKIPIPYSMSQTVDNGIQNALALERAYTNAREHMKASDMAALKLYMDAFKKSEQDLQRQVLDFIEIAKSKPHPDEWMEASADHLEDAMPWFFEYFEERIIALEELTQQMVEACDVLEFGKAREQETNRSMFEQRKLSLSALKNDLHRHDWIAFRTNFLTSISQMAKMPATLAKTSFKTIQASAKKYEKEIADRLFTLEDYEQFTLNAGRYCRIFIALALEVFTLFEKEKDKAGFIDFSDMEQFALLLLENPAVAQEVQKQYNVILVDEFQDTNPLQEQIIELCARDNNVTRVGDLKQSIYGFRQARPDIMKELMAVQDDTSEVLYMDENYRSSKTVVDFNNAFYQKLMNLPYFDSQFSKEDEARIGSEIQEQMKQFPVRVLYTEYGGWKDPESSARQNDVQARKAHMKNRVDMIAKDILQLTDPKGPYGDQKIQLRDIAILCRTSTPFKALKEGLNAYGIKAIGQEKEGFYTNQAIQIILSALRVMNNPDDDISFMALICSPLGGISYEEVIAAGMQRDENDSLYRIFKADPRVMKLMEKLNGLKDSSIAEMLQKLYNMESFYLLHTSAQDKTNLDLLMERASGQDAGMQLQDFLDNAALEEGLNQMAQALPFGREEDAVKLSTIHGSKGLQYKVVYVFCDEKYTHHNDSNPFLMDSDLGLCAMNLSDNGHIRYPTFATIAFKEKAAREELQEMMRLLYVATTRAKEHLIFVGSLKSVDELYGSITMDTLLSKSGFLVWLLETFPEGHPLMELDLQKTVSKRQEKPWRNPVTGQIDFYAGNDDTLKSRTASASKTKLAWPNPTVRKGGSSLMSRKRGTLFHEMAEHLSYPYVRSDVEAYASKRGMLLSDEDIDQFLALNDQPVFANWMNKKHDFELPYVAGTPESIMHGYMDLVVEDGDDIHILDFKTDRAFDMSQLIKTYTPQLEVYRQAMEQIHPDKHIHTWLYSFFLKDLQELQ